MHCCLTIQQATEIKHHNLDREENKGNYYESLFQSAKLICQITSDQQSILIQKRGIKLTIEGSIGCSSWQKSWGLPLFSDNAGTRVFVAKPVDMGEAVSFGTIPVT